MNPIEQLIQALQVLPGIGKKTAHRLAYYLLRCPEEEVKNLLEALSRLRQEMVPCQACFYISQKNPCDICRQPDREPLVCVVSDSMHVDMLEATGIYKGYYHVLGGILNPLHGVKEEDLTLHQLLKRCQEGKFKEVILALPTTAEGIFTSRYVERLLKDLSLKVSELARGLSVGADLEYVDPITLQLALEGRRQVPEP